MLTERYVADAGEAVEHGASVADHVPAVSAKPMTEVTLHH